MRIYELAKELGVDNKTLLAKAHELGMTDKKSHSNALSELQADTIRRSFLRVDVEDSGSSEKTISTSVDETGQKSQLVERRSGGVIRRRRKVVEEEKPSEIIQESTEPVPEQAEPEASQIEVTEAVEETIEADDKAGLSKQEEKTSGPRVLGKIELASAPKIEKKQTAPEPKTNKLTKFKNYNVDLEEDTEDIEDKKKNKKKKGRVVEFSRGDLVDYETTRRKSKTLKTEEKNQEESIAAEEKSAPAVVVKKAIKISSENITVGELASEMSLKSGQVIAKLIELGVMATINQPIDLDTATILAEELGFEIEYVGFDEDDMIKIEGIDDPAKQQARPPVVTVMGHVDHGKTSLLDYIRKSTIATKEHGGITQHIGAYVVPMQNNKSISFIDTPGHAAFTEMRARGADLTDIVILVVAADDGVMPQTLEALSHAKAAEVPVIVAINKIDKPDATPDKVKTQLSEHGLQPEDWGGDTMFVPVSAHTGEGVENLLESILLVAEVQELTANPDCRVKGTVIEVKQEQGRGTVSTILVQAGTLNVGDVFLVGANYGKVRSMMNHNRKEVKSALPSTPVEITGFNGTPEAGDDFVVMESENKAKEVASFREQKLREKRQIELAGGPISLEEFAEQAAMLDALELRVIVKADVHGSLEAVRKSLEDLTTDEVSVKIIHAAVGGISESDIQLASASNTIIVGFNVRGEPRAMQQAESQGIDIRFYRVIYELIDDVKKAMGGLLSPEEKEENLGRVEVRETFSVPKVGTIAGCYVTDGTVLRGSKVRLLRDSVVVYEGQMGTLRRFKDDVKEVQSGYECGMSIDGYQDIKIGDVIEVYKVNQIQRTLD